MSLSDYMPYGAPELIDGAASRMARSTLVATGLVAMLTWCAGIAGFGGHAVVPVKPETIPGWVFLPPPRFPDQPPSAKPTRIVQPTNPFSIPKPVFDPPPVEPTMDERGPIDANEPPDTRGPGGPPGMVSPEGCLCGGGPPPTEYVYRDVEPELLRSSDPVYPDLARDAGEEGTVLVQMLVGLTGRVERAVLAPGSRPTMLDEAALAAARTCVFKPALANGHPVAVWVARAYRFRLH